MVQNYCTSCGAELISEKEFCPKCLLRVAVIVPDVSGVTNKKQDSSDTSENRTKNLKEYKVFSIKTELLEGGALNTKKLEEKVNFLAKEGWIVKGLTTNNPGNSPMSQTIVILERDLP
jgi:hypothetical protein